VALGEFEPDVNCCSYVALLLTANDVKKMKKLQHFFKKAYGTFLRINAVNNSHYHISNVE
jgi:hypothetical protein